MTNDEVYTTMPRTNRIPHYYGDVVRNLFVAAAVAIFAALPIFPDLIPTVRPFLTVIFGILLVGIAALIHPKNNAAMLIAVIISAVGGAMFEISAIGQFDIRAVILPSFLVRQAVAILLLFALYFSGRTYRSMKTPGQIRLRDRT